MWLVLLSHSMDDLPYGLFHDRKSAVEFGNALQPDLAPEWWHNDASTPICVNLIELQDTVNDGLGIGGYFPVNGSMETLKTFTDEEFKIAGFTDYDSEGPAGGYCVTQDNPPLVTGGLDPLLNEQSLR